jgi:hypothetical protein
MKRTESLKKGITRLTTRNIDLYYKALVLNNAEYFYKWDIDTYSTPENMKRVFIRKPMNQVSLEHIFLFCFASQTSELHIDDDTYKISDEKFNTIFREVSYEQALDYCKSKCRVELQKKYPGNHVNWWNADKLFIMLQKAGFETIYLSGYSQSLCPVLRNTEYFDNTHPNLSIYVETQNIVTKLAAQVSNYLSCIKFDHSSRLEQPCGLR